MRKERDDGTHNASCVVVFLKGGFTALRMSMNQNTFSPLLAMTQACLIKFVVY